MGTIQEAMGVLSDAETSLRQLIESALRDHRYADVGVIAGLADGIARLLQNQVATDDQQSDSPSVPTMASVPAADKSLLKMSSKSRNRAYPRFENDGGKLVKVGWSKKNKSTYEHRAPREAVIAFIRHFSGNVIEGKVFAVEDLLPVPDIANGGEIPAYQVYLTLAWLQHVGAVEKKGRDGYVLRRGGLGNGTLDSYWASLPERSE